MDVFTNLYEGGFLSNIFHFGQFSDDMFDANAYMLIGLIMIITSFIFEVIYYFLLSNYGRFYKTIFWLVWTLLIGLINFFVAYYYSSEAIYNFYLPADPPNYTTEYFSFSMVNVLWSIVLSVIFSLFLKIKSTKASRTPF